MIDFSSSRYQELQRRLQREEEQEEKERCGFGPHDFKMPQDGHSNVEDGCTLESGQIAAVTDRHKW